MTLLAANRSLDDSIPIPRLLSRRHPGVSGTWDRHRPSKANEIRLNEIGTKSYVVHSSRYRCLVVSRDHGRNSRFELVWNRNYIDYVEITAAETVGVENCAAF
ncbi:MAG TPA: hypothetical protein VH350_12505 [Candidatus Sulfotelmatobacter sp.]|nr:hypothetical protein [Candidatus Sulfotelmatobacter sp.]